MDVVLGGLLSEPVDIAVKLLIIVTLNVMSVHLLPVSLVPRLSIPIVAVRLGTPAHSTERVSRAVLHRLERGLVRVGSLRGVDDRTDSKSKLVHVRFARNSSVSCVFVRTGRGISHSVKALGKVSEPGILRSTTSSVPSFCVGLDLGSDGASFVSLDAFTSRIVTGEVRRLPRITVISMDNLIVPRLLVIPSRTVVERAKLGVSSFRDLIGSTSVGLKDLAVESKRCECGIGFRSFMSSGRSVRGVYLGRGKEVFHLGRLTAIIRRPTVHDNLMESSKGRTVSLTIVGRDSIGVTSLHSKVGGLVGRFDGSCPRLSFRAAESRARLLRCSVGGLVRGVVIKVLLTYVIVFLFVRSFQSPLLITLAVPATLVFSVLVFFLYNLAVGVVSLSKLLLKINVVISGAVILASGVATE